MQNQFWIGLALPGVAILGLLCAALAQAYARCIVQGAAIDGATLRAAGRAAVFDRGWAQVPHRLAVLCAGLLALACLPFMLQPSYLAASRFAACAVLLTLALIDGRCGLLPDALTLPLLWAGLLLAWAGVGVGLHDAVAGAAAGYALLRGMDMVFEAWRGRAGMGGGDMKLVAALGAWLGWAALPVVLLAACVAAAAVALLRHGSKAWRSTLAFGPFLALAGAARLVGEPVVQFLF